MKKNLTLILIILAVSLRAQLPVAITLGHDVITSGPHNFNLYGVVESPLDSVQYTFVYSADVNFTTPTSTPVHTVISDSLQLVYATVNSLLPATTYYYYLSASTIHGTVNADTLHFYSDTLSQVFEIYGADMYPGQYGNFASMNGLIKGIATHPVVSFEWGPSPTQLDSVFLSDMGTLPDANQHNPRASVQQGLVTGKTYYYRMKGVTAIDSIFTDIRPFFIGYPYDIVQSLPANSLTANTGNLNGEVQGFDVPLKLDVEYGIFYYNHHTLLVYVATDTALYNFVHPATQLQNNYLYGYRFRAESWFGNFYGDDIFFITGNKDSVFQTHNATGVVDTSATLNAYENHMGFQMVAGFEYGTTRSLGTYMVADTIPDTLSYRPTLKINGLLPGTTYYFSARSGRMGNGNYSPGPYIYGDTLQFTTSPVGIANLPGEPFGVKIYPNPVTSDITFTTGSNNDFSSIKICDIEGRELITKNVSAGNSLNVSFLAPGVYLFQAFNKAGEIRGVTRFVKQ